MAELSSSADENAVKLKQQRLFRLKFSFLTCWLMMFGLFAVDFFFDAQSPGESISRRQLVGARKSKEDSKDHSLRDEADEWNENMQTVLSAKDLSVEGTIKKDKEAIEENDEKFKLILEKYITAKRQVTIATNSIKQLQNKKTEREKFAAVINKGSDNEHDGIADEAETGVAGGKDTEALEATLEDDVADIGTELNDLSKKITETTKYRDEQKKREEIYHDQMKAIIKKDHNERDILGALTKLEKHAIKASAVWKEGVVFEVDDKTGAKHGTHVHTVQGAPNVVRIKELFESADAACQFKVYIGSDGCDSAEGKEICTVGGNPPCSDCENTNLDLKAVRESARRRMQKDDEKKEKDSGGASFCLITQVFFTEVAKDGEEDPECELKGKAVFVPADEEEENFDHCKPKEKKTEEKKPDEEPKPKEAEAEEKEKEADKESAGWRATYVSAYPYLVTLLTLAIAVISSVFMLVSAD